jgi:hypothetical protein
MTLAELRRCLESLRSTLTPADAKIVGLLIASIAFWKENDETPDVLGASLDRALGQSWLSSDLLHRRVHDLLLQFRPTITSVGGMTMNERLVMFDLMERWDRSSEEEREVLYAKVVARR